MKEPEACPAHADVLVIGGGPAGSTLSARLAQLDHDVVLFEKDRFPRGKLCGEFLSGESRAVLEQLGCLDEFLSLGPAEITGARFTSPSGEQLDVPLAESSFGISRLALDQLLFRRAARSGARTYEEATVESVESPLPPASDPPSLGWATTVRVRRPARAANEEIPPEWRAALVVGAHGRREAIDRILGRPFYRRRHPHVGFKSHLCVAGGRRGEQLRDELSGFVEVHPFAGGYCGLNFVETGEVNACCLLEERFLRRLDSKRWPDLLRAMADASEPLRRRLGALEVGEDAVHAVANVPFASKERSGERVLYLGDAAGMIAPLCGNGQAMALRSAVLLADLIAERSIPRSREEFDAIAALWNRRWKSEFSTRMRLSRVLQPALLRRAPVELGVRLLQRFPRGARWLARVTRGRSS